MKKQIYQLAIGFLGLFSAITIHAQKTHCDSVYLSPGMNTYDVYLSQEFERCEQWMNYEVFANSYAKEPVYFQWKTKAGKFLTQGTSFSDDTLGEFVLEVESMGCLKDYPFTVNDGPEIFLDATSLEYCAEQAKPTLSVNVWYKSNRPIIQNQYMLYRDNQFVANVFGFYELKNAQAGTYTVVALNQQCLNSNSSITIKEKNCTPVVCEPLSDSLYDVQFDGQIYHSCDVAGWHLNFPDDKKPANVEISWKKNGVELQKNNVSLVINVDAVSTPDVYSVEVTGAGCKWSKEVEIVKDSINNGITTSDANYKHCASAPIVIAAKGNNHLTGEEYIWEKKDVNGVYQLHGKGDTLPNPSVGYFRMYVKTQRECVSMPTTFNIVEGQCATSCAQFMYVQKENYNPLPGELIGYNSNHFYICDQQQLGLYASFMPISTGSVTWYNVTTSTEQNVGGNPLYTTIAGKYLARYTNGNCVVHSDTITIDYAYPQPLEIKVFEGSQELEVKNKTITICPSRITLKSDPYYFSYYNWEKNAVYLSNDDQLITDQAGYYTLTTVNYQGCRAEDHLTVNINQSPNCVISGVGTINSPSVEVSPNPVVSSLYIKGLQVQSVQVVSQLGHVTTEQVSNGELSLENYSAGIYTVLIENNGKIEAHRIVKQ